MSNSGNDNKHLAWFLGPKAENAELMESCVLQILRDYFHWRKNYFPSDAILMPRSLQREFDKQHDLLSEHIDKLMAELRRNFPFYSPRYIAHELSDTLIPSTLGYMAGLLFNPNNVTPEAAPVTTELEIEACGEILSMLGYEPAPSLPKPTDDVDKYYERTSKKEFGWAHITSGGTVANIEALWIARQVRYFPLAVQEAARSKNLEILIQLPSDTEGRRDIREIQTYQLLLLKPNEAIYLLPRYLEALRKSASFDGPEDKFGQVAWQYLNETKYGLSQGTGPLFSQFPPAILVAGSRHYSIAKAADVIGVGQSNIVSVKTDELFRVDTKDLEHQLGYLLKSRRVPLCVIATVGTTEEGAVDPVHEIIDLRTKMERESNASFWLHVDSAWGGFLRSLFCMEAEDEAILLARKAAVRLNIPFRGELQNWHNEFANRVEESISAGQADAQAEGDGKSRIPSNIKAELLRMSGLAHSLDYRGYVRAIEHLPGLLKTATHRPTILGDDLRLTLSERRDWVREYVSDQVKIDLGEGGKPLLTISWPPKGVADSYFAMAKADSITVDPHKMGYVPYPCGCAAFKNDRVRLFVMQRAPYITARTPDTRFHLPPRHAEVEGSNRSSHKTVIDAFSPYILEGSRPGAAAAALWMTVKCAPLTARGHGSITKHSLLAALEVYEWLTHWNVLVDAQEHGIDYRFIPLTPQRPDTNLITFVVKKKTSNSLADLNRLTKLVYDDFSIQSELGEREYSYSQAFFLSNTIMKYPEYPVEVLDGFFKRADLCNSAKDDYDLEGLVVLRASVMTPYITTSRRLAGQDFARIFVEELARSAARHVREL